MAIGTGRMVRRPWITSKPNSAGMPNRLPWTVSRCRRLISAGSVTNSSEPTSPLAMASSTVAAFGASPPWPGAASALTSAPK
jgi:hypothetical protein